MESLVETTLHIDISPMSRASRRKLSCTGVSFYNTPSLSTRASSVAAQRSNNVCNLPVGASFDNCYRKRWLATASGADISLNCTIFAMLPLQHEPDVFPSYPKLGALFAEMHDVGTTIVGSHATLLSNLDNASLTLKDVRCATDLKRNGVDTLQLKSLLFAPLL